MAVPPSPALLCLGGGFLLLNLLKTKFMRRRRQSASSSDQAVEEHENIYATEQPEDGVSEWSNSRGGLESEEPKMLDHLPGSEADCPLIQWLQQREDNGIKPLATFEMQGVPRQTYICDEIKDLIKSLIQSVQDLHSRGQCVSGGTFLAKNISVVGGKWKFGTVELSRLTEKLRQDNYNSIESMITTVILREKAKQLPYDMQHLLKLLKNPRPPIYLISNHVGLMNLSSCIYLYQLLWNKKKAMTPTAYSKWENAIQDLDICCWSKSISKESPLFKVYKAKKGWKYKGGRKDHLICFLRNAAEHLNDQSGRGEIFQYEHISLIIAATFPTILADLQERMHHHGILQEFLPWHTSSCQQPIVSISSPLILHSKPLFKLELSPRRLCGSAAHSFGVFQDWCRRLLITMGSPNIRDILTAFSPSLDFLAVSSGDGRIKQSCKLSRSQDCKSNCRPFHQQPRQHHYKIADE